MKLVSLTANKSSFHPVIFKDGLNIIVGQQAASSAENDGNTYNGVGKSLILHLIHFCLGSNKIDTFTEKLEGWKFTLTFSINGENYSCSRSTQEQGKIYFNGEELSPRKLNAQIIELCFDEKIMTKNMTFNTLFSRFVRRFRSCYIEYDKYVPKESDYSKLLNNAYLLGLDTELIIKKKELRDKQTTADKTENAIKKDAVFKQYYLGESDAELDKDDLDYKIKELKKEIASFKISSNYHDIEKEADEKSYKKKILENRRVIINSNIKNIEKSLNHPLGATDNNIYKIYEAANIEIPSMVKKSIDEVLNFHNSMIVNRTKRLSKELLNFQKQLKDIDREITVLGTQMDELLRFLDSHGALEEYSSLNSQLSAFQREASRIEEYQKILKSYKDLQLEIKEEYIEQDKSMNLYLLSEQDYISKLKETFQHYAKRFYPKKRSGLVVRNNSGENTIRCEIEARIEDDSSDGVNEVRLFCFDLLILLCKISKVRFLMHDSRLFANMDPRQRESLFRIISNVCSENELQYICTINEDALLSFKNLFDDVEYKKIILDNVRLELKDDCPESKLLGIQVDIDLEENTKTKEMN